MPWFKPSMLPAACLLAFSLCTSRSHAQSPVPLKDSRELITQGVAQHDKGEYKKALEFYRQVPEGDTNYSAAITEMLITYLADSSYREAVTLARQGLLLPRRPAHREFMLYLGHAYDYLGKTDSALACYDSLIRLNPYDHQPLFEKGMVWLRKDQYEKSMGFFRRSLMLNPYHFGSHKGMSLALMHEGRLSEAYLAAATGLFTTNNKDQAHAAIYILNAIREQTDEVAKAYKDRDPNHTDPAFEDIDAIISAKMPQSAAYKIESALGSDGIIKNLHAIMEKVRYDKEDSGFAMQFYVPLYRQAIKDDQFDPFILLMFSGYDIESVDKLAKKNKGDLKEIRSMVFGYLDQIAATQTLNYSDRKAAKERYAIVASESYFIVGGLKSKDPLVIAEGPVMMYKEGVLTAAGPYNANGKKEGEWKTYYPSGILETLEHYRDGKLTGEASSYFRNGNLYKSYVFDNDGVQQEETEYEYNGVLSSRIRKKGDDNMYISYHPNGTKEVSMTLSGDKIADGHYKYYYDNGAIYKELDIANQKKEGTYKEYYRDGAISEQMMFRGGKREGEYRSFHANGKPHYKAGYAADKLDGPYEEYDEEGKLVEKGAYHNGKKTGEEQLFAPDGRQYGTISYKNDAPSGYRFADATGKVLAENSDGRSFSRLVVYSADGNKISEVPYSDGKANGIAKYYFATGGLMKTVSYTDDQMDGAMKEYYHNGRAKSERSYKEDVEDGYVKQYYASGILQWEGWTKAGRKQGAWRNYNPSGKPAEEIYYLDDKRSGPDKNFWPDGRLSYVDLYDKGVLEGVIRYDTAGREQDRDYFAGGNGNYRLKFPNGKSIFECAVIHGVYQGPYIKYLPNGNVLEKGFFRYGVRDSTLDNFSFNGKLHVKGNHKNSERDGLWVYYDDNGTRTRELTYKNGELEGSYKIWEAGVLRYEYNNHKDEYEGNQIIYGDGGKIACVLVYRKGDITGYTYQGKDGKLVAVIPLKNGTGSITAFYPDGSKSAELHYKENVQDGKQLLYYSNGQVAEERNYEASDLNGPYKRWTPAGKLLYEAVYKNDELTGKELTYDASGALVSSLPYIDGGILHGPAVYTDPKSGKSMKVLYHYDQAMSIN